MAKKIKKVEEVNVPPGAGRTIDEVNKVAIADGSKIEKPKSLIILKNVSGEDVDEGDYFFSDGSDKEKECNTVAPSYFNKVCGFPVDREDLLEVFNKIFKPEDNFLFYKNRETEVYVIIVPLKFGSTIGVEHNSISGDYQKHAISFIAEGSANPVTLKQKLLRVAQSVKYTDK